MFSADFSIVEYEHRKVDKTGHVRCSRENYLLNNVGNTTVKIIQARHLPTQWGSLSRCIELYWKGLLELFYAVHNMV